MIMPVCNVAPQPSLLCPVIRAEYLDMPGLNLTHPQACRLWNAEPWVCRDALEMLVDSGFLMEAGGRYLRSAQTRRDGWSI